MRKFLVLFGFLFIGCASVLPQGAGFSSSAEFKPMYCSTATAGLDEASIRAFFQKHTDGTRAIPETKHSFEARKGPVVFVITVDDEYAHIYVPIAPLYDFDPKIRFMLAWRFLQANFDRTELARYSIMKRLLFASMVLPRGEIWDYKLSQAIVVLSNMYTNAFRTGPNSYSARSPDADGKDIDPREDSTLDDEKWFEKQSLDPTVELPKKSEKPTNQPNRSFHPQTL